MKFYLTVLKTIICFIIVLIGLLFWIFLFSSNDIGYTTFDPFRDKFLELREHPFPQLTNNKNPIPKIIHQIWIGDKALPDPYERIMQTCKNMSGFEHKLWTNNEIETLLSESEEYKAILNKIPEHDKAVKKDFLSYIILKKYGGVVLDCSMACRGNLNKLHEGYSYYFLYPYFNATYAFDDNILNHTYLIGAGVIAATKNSPIVSSILEKFKNFVVDYKMYNQKYTSPTFANKDVWHGWMGQVVINEAVDEYCFIGRKKCEDIYILPRSEYYFPYYPDKDKSFFKNALIIDTDGVPFAYIIKAFYTKSATLDTFLNLK